MTQKNNRSTGPIPRYRYVNAQNDTDTNSDVTVPFSFHYTICMSVQFTD